MNNGKNARRAFLFRYADDRPEGRVMEADAYLRRVEVLDLLTDKLKTRKKPSEKTETMPDKGYSAES